MSCGCNKKSSQDKAKALSQGGNQAKPSPQKTKPAKTTKEKK